VAVIQQNPESAYQKQRGENQPAVRSHPNPSWARATGRWFSNASRRFYHRALRATPHE
jgi:hypothetical protein